MSEPKPPMPPLRVLVINLMLALFISVCVFVVIAQIYIVPTLAGQQVQLQSLRAELNELKAQIAEDEAEEDVAPEAPAPVAPVAPSAPAAAVAPPAPPAPKK